MGIFLNAAKTPARHITIQEPPSGPIPGSRTGLQGGPIPARKVYIHKGTLQKVWEAINPPAITAFSVAPATIDLDTRPTGNLTFSLAVTGTAGQDTHAQIVQLPDGQDIGTSFSGINGANISESLPNIPQPTETTNYRLIARNNGGQSFRDAQVAVTQNPQLSNLAVTALSAGPSAPQGETIRLSGKVIGFPRPNIFIDNGIGRVSARHFTKVAGEVNASNFSITHFYGSVAQRTFNVRAENTSGFVTRQVTHTP